MSRAMRLEELELRAPKVITLPELAPDRFRLRKRWSSIQGSSVEPRKIDKVITPFLTAILVLSSSGWRKLVHTADLPRGCGHFGTGAWCRRWRCL